MRATTRGDRARGADGAGRRLAPRLWDARATLLWLWLLWAVLWGSASPLVLTAGAVVAVAVVLLFPLPPVAHRGSLRPLRLAALVGHLLADLVGSAVVVAREALLRGPRVRAAVLEVPVRSDSDLLFTAAAQLTTLTPGTLVLEADRDRLRLYVHALPARDASETAARRREVERADRWVVRAFGAAGARGGAERREEGPR